MKFVEAVRPYLPLDKPWILAALALSAGILLYGAFVGYQTLGVSCQINATFASIDQHSRLLPNAVPDEAGLTAQLERAEADLARLVAIHQYGESDDLVSIIVDVSKSAGVSIDRVTVGDMQRQENNEIGYQTLIVSIVVSGAVADTYNFFSLLGEVIPVVEVRNVSLSGFTGVPTTNATLAFYLSPEQAAPAAPARR